MVRGLKPVPQWPAHEGIYTVTPYWGNELEDSQLGAACAPAHNASRIRPRRRHDHAADRRRCPAGVFQLQLFSEEEGPAPN
jgi:hypothetical protein